MRFCVLIFIIRGKTKKVAFSFYWFISYHKWQDLTRLSSTDRGRDLQHYWRVVNHLVWSSMLSSSRYRSTPSRRQSKPVKTRQSKVQLKTLIQTCLKKTLFNSECLELMKKIYYDFLDRQKFYLIECDEKNTYIFL